MYYEPLDLWVIDKGKIFYMKNNFYMKLQGNFHYCEINIPCKANKHPFSPETLYSISTITSEILCSYFGESTSLAS